MVVKAENRKLRSELEDTRSTLKNLTVEASHENFDERRVNLLKLQLIQLQRQVLLVFEVLGSRSTALMEVENTFTWLLNKFRHYIALEVKGAAVPVLRADLIVMVDTSESARIKLFKSVQNCSKENLVRPQMFMNPFLNPRLTKDYSLLDCCMGKTECLNLKHVTQLESKLATLYKELIKVSEYLTSPEQSGSPRSSGGHLLALVREREGTIILRAGAMARDCASDLLSLSLLFPSAPWPPMKRPAVSDITYDTLALSLPPLPKGKAAEVQHCVTAALQACNYRCLMAGQEVGALREEIRFHQAVYQLQVDYVLQAFKALRDGYREFEQSTNEILIQPMKKLMDAYTDLKNNTHKDGLREFLTILKEHEQQWVELIQKLDPKDQQYQSGSQAVSAFGEEFLRSLDSLVLAQQIQRDKAAMQKEELKNSQNQLEEELRVIIQDVEEQRRTTSELNTCDPSYITKSVPDKVSSFPVSFGSEEVFNANTGIPFLVNEDKTNKISDKMKKRHKTTDKCALSHKPWVDSTEDVRLNSSDNSSWLDEPGKRAEEMSVYETQQSKEDCTPSAGLRPWLDEQYAEEERWTHKGKRLVTVKEKYKNRRDECVSSAAGDSSANSGQKSPTLNNYTPLFNYRGGNERNIRSDNNNRPFHESNHLRKSPSVLQQTKDGQNRGNYLPPDLNFLSDKPPRSADAPTSRQHLNSISIKGKFKAMGYEPNLGVAKRTLSLRKYGSLNKLSEPSIQEPVIRMSLSNATDVSSSSNSMQSNMEGT